MAQSKQITLSGTMMVATGEKFPYRIVFTESEGVIKGYSYTFSDPQETKTVIKGVLDRSARTLRFKETEIVSSQGVRTKAFMCLVNAKLEYMHGTTGNELMGPITSSDVDKAACTPGDIIFNNDKELDALFASQEKFDTVISMKKKTPGRIMAFAPDPTVKKIDTLITDKITAGNEKSYEWHSDTVVLDIWDGGNIDGDKVSIQFNGKTVLSQFFLSKEKRRLHLPIEGTGINTLVIIADNEGSDPPNTATIALFDGAKKYNIIAYNLKGQQALIKVKRVR
jgi:hypothetical protein